MKVLWNGEEVTIPQENTIEVKYSWWLVRRAYARLYLSYFFLRVGMFLRSVRSKF